MDVVTVADFAGPAAKRFELRALLFLGAWMRHQGTSRSWPLHLACIGNPPVSVRRLAALAGASVTVHEPAPPPHFATGNKLRGLEVAPTTDRFLLLDTDVLILGDLDPLAQMVGGGIGAGPARFNLLSEPIWRRVFDSVGGRYPVASGPPPYYNSGVLMAPWSLGLGGVWWEHVRRILQAFSADPLSGDWKWRRHAEQYGLATAIEGFRQQDISVTAIPPAFHARPYLLLERVVPWRDVALFHYVKVLTPEEETVEGIARLLYGRRLPRARRWLAGRLGLRAIRSPVFRLVAPDRLRAHPAFYEHVHQIFRDHIAPVIEVTTARSPK
ncbi:MAG: hypothetical protein QME77_08850 [bacterium]|nr:hypothetical protein [bacterium]